MTETEPEELGAGSFGKLGTPRLSALSKLHSRLAENILNELPGERGGTLIVGEAHPIAEELEPHVPRPATRVSRIAHATDRILQGGLDLVLITDDENERWYADSPDTSMAIWCKTPVICLPPECDTHVAPTLTVPPNSFWSGHYRLRGWTWDEDDLSSLLPRCQRLAGLFRTEEWARCVASTEAQTRARKPLGLILGLPHAGAGATKSLAAAFKSGARVQSHRPQGRPTEEHVQYEFTTNPDLAQHLEDRTEFDFAVVWGCGCENRELLIRGIRAAHERGVPVLVPKDCAFAPNRSVLHMGWYMHEQPHLLGCAPMKQFFMTQGFIGSEETAVLVERAAWLHSKGLPWVHLIP